MIENDTWAEGISLADLAGEVNKLIESGASTEVREEYLEKLQSTLLDKHSSTILGKYIGLVGEVLNPNTDSALNSEALTKLGALVADKMDAEAIYNSNSEDAKSAVKVLSALKGLSGVINLVQHNLDPNDPTKLADEHIQGIALDMLDEFDLSDNAMDFTKEGGEFFVAGSALLAAVNTRPLNPIALVQAAQVALKEGTDVFNEVNKVVPEINALVRDISAGTNLICEHVKCRMEDLGEEWSEFCSDMELATIEYNADLIEAAAEARDGDGYNDGVVGEYWGYAGATYKMGGKFVKEFGEFVSYTIGFGHDEEDEMPAEVPVREVPAVELPLEVPETPSAELPVEEPAIELPSDDEESSSDTELPINELPSEESSIELPSNDALEVLPTFEGVERVETTPSLEDLLAFPVEESGGMEMDDLPPFDALEVLPTFEGVERVETTPSLEDLLGLPVEEPEEIEVIEELPTDTLEMVG